MAIQVDTRSFSHAGSTLCNGAYKARFANHPSIRTKVLENEGHTEINLVALPQPMTKLEAIAWLRANKPVGVNQASLDAKENYINTQFTTIEKQSKPKVKKAAKIPSGRKRGRPPLSPEVKAARLATKSNVKALKNSLPKLTPNPSQTVTTAVNSNPVVTSIVAGVQKARVGSIRAKAAATVVASATHSN